MKILVLSSEVWNDKINGNNVISNWFEGMDAEFANIYGSPDTPFNKCCKKYFQITDSMMLKSIIGGCKAGRKLEFIVDNSNLIIGNAESEPKKLYSFLKKISGHLLRLIREIIWILGRYDKLQMKQFIEEFNPDIIFSERMASCKMLRLEKVITELCDVPMVAFTGDDEYSLQQLKISPFFWINRFMIRSRLREMVKKYKIYYTLSLEQKLDYEKRFNCKCKVLQKCGDFENDYVPLTVHNPIKLIYAGKFYCNRWKVLAQIAEQLKEINKTCVKMVLEIYTKDIPNKKQRKLLDDQQNSFIMGGVSQEKLREIYHDSDIALHVESCGIKYRLETRLSFSTKIVDCIESGCAILAYCWNQHSGLTYLKRENAAICVSNRNELRDALLYLCDNKSEIQKYSRYAYECGQRNHKRSEVQRMLISDFEDVINNQY